MAITIFQPITFSELGLKDNNEDYLCPTDINTNTKLFMVCDGMGGLDKGEDASKITAETIAQYFSDNPFESLTDEYLQKAVGAAFCALKAYMEMNSLISSMGTTLALLYINENGATVLHIGDSRVYHIRNGQILYKTKDHKQVLDMVEEGIITKEQAVNHPWRNRLSRSISVRKGEDEEACYRGTKLNAKIIENVQIDDYFFMCTDGVFECVDDQILVKILNIEDISNQQKINRILEVCRGKTTDNYSGYLLQIKNITHGNNITDR